MESSLEKARSVKSDLTQEEFEQKKAAAENRHASAHEFTHVGGGVMMDASELSSDDREQMADQAHEI